MLVALSGSAAAAKARNSNAAKLIMDLVFREKLNLCYETQIVVRPFRTRASCTGDAPGQVKIAAIDPRVGEELTNYSKERLAWWT